MKNHFAIAVVAASALVATCHQAAAKARHHRAVVKPQVPHENIAWVGEKGVASYYSAKYNGRVTSSGQRFDQTELTAAHPWLPFGTKVRVTLARGGSSVIVTITDRLYSARRVVDLSRSAAEQLGMVRMGVAEVSLSPV